MGLTLQRAGVLGGTFLEALLDAAETASGGGAIFAWTNASGVAAFLDDRSFQALAGRGQFKLVVGTDTITDKAALAALQRVEALRPNLKLSFFLHDRAELFHPKLAWFEYGGRMRLLVGSANLTMGGLKKNWEAYVDVLLTNAESKRTTAAIDSWFAEHATQLLDSADARVAARVARNVGNERRLKIKPATLPKSAERAATRADKLLIVEVPKQTGRQGQINVKLENYTSFFGFVLGSKRRIYLYSVDLGGALAPVEVRYNVEVKSDNYRFDLGKLRGITYDLAQRPIVLFMRIGPDEFLYMLVNRGDPNYGLVDKWLDAKYTGPKNELRRAYASLAELRAVWPAAGLLNAVLPEL